jgi:hypothetical protein
MKRILFTIASLISLSVFSQEKNPKITGYVSAGLSIPGGSQSFKTRSYASIESGICYENVTAGLVIGRASLDKADFRNMFWEIKASPSIQISPVLGYAVLGYGGYFDYKKSFLEYGFGVYYPFKRFAYFAQVTNWDEVNYMTVGLIYNFKIQK